MKTGTRKADKFGRESEVAEGKNQPALWGSLKNQIYLGTDAFVQKMVSRKSAKEDLSGIPLGRRRAMANARGTPCVCDAGYEFDATRTSCVQEQYTLTLTTLGKIEPSGSANVIAKVINTLTGQPKDGVAVSLKADVEVGTGGHDHHDASRPKGTLSATTGSTGADGTVTMPPSKLPSPPPPVGMGIFIVTSIEFIGYPTLL